MTFPTYDKEIQDDLKKFGIMPYPLSEEFKSHIEPHQKFIYSTSKGGIVNKLVCTSCDVLYNNIPTKIKGSSRYECLFCEEQARLFTTSPNELITKTDSYNRTYVDVVINKESLRKESNLKSIDIHFNEFIFDLNLTNLNYGESKKLNKYAFTFKEESDSFSIICNNVAMTMKELCNTLNYYVFVKLIKFLSINEFIHNLFGKSILVKALIHLDGTFCSRFVDLNIEYYYEMKRLDLFESFSLENHLDIKESMKRIFLVRSLSMSDLKELDVFIKNNTVDDLKTLLETYTARNSILFAIFCINRGFNDFDKINEWENSLEGFTNRKLLLVDLITSNNEFKPDVLNDYIDYLVQYEALSRTKAISHYVSYLKKQKLNNVEKFELYPKDILLKI